MKKLDQFLHTLFWVAPGMFAGIALYEYADYKARPDLYAMWSAPWYVDAGDRVSLHNGGGMDNTEDHPEAAGSVSGRLFGRSAGKPVPPLIRQGFALPPSPRRRLFPIKNAEADVFTSVSAFFYGPVSMASPLWAGRSSAGI